MDTIPAIEEFIGFWKQKTTDYYKEAFADVRDQRKRMAELYPVKMVPRKSHPFKVRYNDPEPDTLVEYSSNAQYSIAIAEKYGSGLAEWLHDNYALREEEREKQLEKRVEKQAKSKREMLYARATAAVGKITDASHLQIGIRGEIEGDIIGEKGKVHLQTVWAGGHNIQQLHYRVLISPLSKET